MQPVVSRSMRHPFPAGSERQHVATEIRRVRLAAAMQTKAPNWKCRPTNAGNPIESLTTYRQEESCGE